MPFIVKVIELPAENKAIVVDDLGHVPGALEIFSQTFLELDVKGFIRQLNASKRRRKAKKEV